MTDEDLPRPDVAPLAPAEGGFEQVVRRARARRARRLSGVVRDSTRIQVSNLT